MTVVIISGLLYFLDLIYDNLYGTNFFNKVVWALVTLVPESETSNSWPMTMLETGKGQLCRMTKQTPLYILIDNSINSINSINKPNLFDQCPSMSVGLHLKSDL